MNSVTVCFTRLNYLNVIVRNLMHHESCLSWLKVLRGVVDRKDVLASILSSADCRQMLNSTSVFEACGHLKGFWVAVSFNFLSDVELLNKIRSTISIFFGHSARIITIFLYTNRVEDFNLC